MESLNMPLRKIILEHSIILERISSKILLLLLRILKARTKTLDNKSSSLSFKNKIDLLHDLEDLNDENYNQLLKFLEIRNQFMHNYECNSFTKLAETNSEITNFLKKHFENKESDLEISFFQSYNDLFKGCEKNLKILLIEYREGVNIDFEKYLNNELINCFDKIIDRAFTKYKTEEPPPIFPITPQRAIESFSFYLQISKSEMASEIISNMKSEVSNKEIFERKSNFYESLYKELVAKKMESDKKPNIDG